MAASERAFRRSLIEEHLEDASFLYQQLVSPVYRAGKNWDAPASFEERLEAHLDGLVVGGELTVEVCGERIDGADPGELFALASVFCRILHAPLLGQVLARLQKGDAPHVAAVERALRADMPAAWNGFAEAALQRERDTIVELLSPACAARRICPDALIHRAGATPPGPSLARALGRLGDTRARPVLLEAMNDARPAMAPIVLLALARLGIPPEAACRGPDRLGDDSLHPVFALAGDRLSGDAVSSAVRDGACGGASLLALGLKGDAADVPLLISLLTDEALASDAAMALHWLTGAPLWVEHFVEDEVDEAALVGDQVDAWRLRREPPRRVDGRPFGETIRALTTSEAAWQGWWNQHRDRFCDGVRYRGGQPMTPRVLLDGLAAPTSDHRMRVCGAEELAIRYGCPVLFEVDMTVRQQRAALAEIARWTSANETRFRAGAWYFAGAEL